jgi:transmembrane sensor
MNHDADRIAEQAAKYLARSGHETPVQRREREAWLSADPRHAREYALHQRLSGRMVDVLRDDPDLQALRTKNLAALDRSRVVRRRWTWSAAAVVLLAVGTTITISFCSAPTPVNYTTGLGERHAETLVDGSQVVLNTDSALEVRYTRRRRDVVLRHGEAQFQVAPDASRPFVVELGEGTVTALGTRFQVRRDAQASVVTLLEGKVEVASGEARRVLRPNEQARLSATGIAVQTIDAGQVDGWVEGWLTFSDAPLGRVVADANRYSLRKLRLAAPGLAELRLSGRFRAGDSAAIAATMARVLPVRVDESGEDPVLLPQ